MPSGCTVKAIVSLKMGLKHFVGRNLCSFSGNFLVYTGVLSVYILEMLAAENFNDAGTYLKREQP